MCFEWDTFILVELFDIVDVWVGFFGIFTDSRLIEVVLRSIFTVCSWIFNSSLRTLTAVGTVFSAVGGVVARITSSDGEDGIGCNADVDIMSRASILVILGFTVP
jgi:hypothetical protein